MIEGLEHPFLPMYGLRIKLQDQDSIIIEFNHIEFYYLKYENQVMASLTN